MFLRGYDSLTEILRDQLFMELRRNKNVRNILRRYEYICVTMQLVGWWQLQPRPKVRYNNPFLSIAVRLITLCTYDTCAE